MFDLDQFVADCRAALKQDRSPNAVREIVARAVSDPAAILKTLGEPTRGELQTLHRADDLTVLNLVWAPNMMLPPHNHLMWARITFFGAGCPMGTGAESRLLGRVLFPKRTRCRLGTTSYIP